MIEKLIKADGTRKNTLCIFSVGKYLDALRKLPDRALFCRIADGLDTEYEAANQSIRDMMQSMRQDAHTVEQQQVWIQTLLKSKTYPIRKKKVIEEPVTELETIQPELPDRENQVLQKARELFEFVAQLYELKGNLVGGKIKLKTDENEQITIRVGD